MCPPYLCALPITAISAPLEGLQKQTRLLAAEYFVDGVGEGCDDILFSIFTSFTSNTVKPEAVKTDGADWSLGSVKLDAQVFSIAVSMLPSHLTYLGT